jgi:hypothetical protein
MEDVDLELGHLFDQQGRQQIELSMVNLETIVFEQALICERHSDIIDMNHSMKSTHTISQGTTVSISFRFPLRWNILSVLTVAAKFLILGCGVIFSYWNTFLLMITKTFGVSVETICRCRCCLVCFAFFFSHDSSQ